MNKNIILVGGGHAHLFTLANLGKIRAAGCLATVVSPSEYHYYSGMGTGMLGGLYSAKETRFNIRKMAESGGAVFIKDRAVKINPYDRTIFLESGNSAGYDVASFNTGSTVPSGHITGKLQDIFPVKPVENLMVAKHRIMELARKKNIKIAVVGGGPSAVEISGNIWRLSKNKGFAMPETGIYCDRFMEKFPGNMKKKIRESLVRHKITIFEGAFTENISTGKIRLKSGQVHSADIIFVAAGVSPSSVFRDSNMRTAYDGGLPVNRFLQSHDHHEIFGGGDCIDFTDKYLDRAGVYAVRQSPVLFHNILAFLQKKPLIPFDSYHGYMMILNMGDGTGILKKGRIWFSGRLAFKIKDIIDRRFMHKFQFF